MVFGPPWIQDVAPHPRDPRELLPVVCAAADELVNDLGQAEKSTRAWSNRPLADALVDDALSRCMARLGKTGCWGQPNRLPSSELWRIAGPLLEVGWLEHRARFKPRGYAGDFEMLDRICRQTCCDHPLGRALDRYFLRQAAPQAVRTRTQQMAAALVADRLRRPTADYHAVSVGSGPAGDIASALAMLPEDRRAGLRVTLLEVDPDALDFAQARLEPVLSPALLECERTNLFRLPKTADGGRLLAQPDFLVCPGLFDYLDEGPAIAMLELFWRQLAPGGLLLVGNFAPHNPTRAYMEWIGNWYLIYRTAAQLEQLARHAAIPSDQFTITSERLGLDLFLVAQKSPSVPSPLNPAP